MSSCSPTFFNQLDDFGNLHRAGNLAKPAEQLVAIMYIFQLKHSTVETTSERSNIFFNGQILNQNEKRLTVLFGGKFLPDPA